MRGSRGEGDRGFAPPPGKSQVLWISRISIWTPPPPLEKSLTPPGKGWALLENVGHPPPPHPPKPCKIIVFLEIRH